MMVRSFFLITCWLTIQNISAQKFTGFSSDTTNKYPQELSNLMGPNLSDNDKQLVFNFINAWELNLFSDNEKKEILMLSSLIFERKGRAPQFKSLITLLLIFKNTANSNENYKTWLEFMSMFIINKKTTMTSFVNFLESLIDLYKGNFLYNTTTTQWRFVGENYKFYVENDLFRVKFSQGAIKCYSRSDSIEIQETSGVYYPVERKWIGEGGIVTWERAGYNPSEVYARLNHYTVDLIRSEYHADSVAFTYGKYFSKPVFGILTDKVMHINLPESSSYPVFDSYSKRFFFKNLYENIDYDGGFSMRGAKIIGSGNETEDAKIIITKIDKILMEVRSKYFVFRPDRINGINTIVKINVDQDSIYHSNLSFIYNVKDKEINLLRNDEYSSKSPYYNSYHKLDMDFEQLTWRIDEPRINLTMARASTIGNAKFESQNFYNQLQFESLQGINSVHPLVALRKLSKMINSSKFPATVFANYLGRSISDVRQVLMTMAQKGFIYYNIATDEVIIKDRLLTYLNSSSGKIDYDVMNFTSTTQAPMDNATLDMENFDLTINGIPNIFLSDSQNVAIYPTRQQIIMKQNRSFQFDGVVDAGLFTFYGNNFFFDYNEFKINLQSIDSVIVKVYSGELDKLGRPVTRRVKSVIQHLTGEMHIDKPDNKSGRRRYPEYPLFTSRENSYVYYQSKEIENGVYPEESFFFQVYPFSIDSLDNFSKEGLVFKGKFQSAGILPTIEQQLVLQPDYSLGFNYDPGPDGIPIYGGKGHLYADINLSNNGLRAKGKVNYLTSTTIAKEFKLYPDSVNTQSEQFTIAEQTNGIQFPKVNSTGNYIHWLTTGNKMFINKSKQPFSIFNDQTTLAGNLILEPGGLGGNGKMDMTTADLYSSRFRYKAQIIDADSSKFHLKSLNKKGFTVLTDNVKAHVDFVSRKGDFTANEDYTLVQFPENKYISYLDYFKWNMDAKTLEMGARRAKANIQKRNGKSKFEDRFHFMSEPEGPRYISVDKKQDSLNFVAPLAVYDYQDNLLNASGVKLIRVADAVIYPSDGKVTIDEKAQMRALYNTKIIANCRDSFHTIHSADINIQGRMSFTGRGKYNYIDENEKAQVVDITEIKVDTAQHTVATGNIVETDNFLLSPFFGFQGRLVLNSSTPSLFFNGGVNLKTNCERMNTSWLKFESELDPKNIYIPVSENPVSINYKKLYVGFFIASDSIHIYPAFLTGRRHFSDQFITSASGFLHYDKDAMVYEIASKEKLLNHDTTGNYVSLHKNNCIAYGEGKLNLGIELGQMKLSSYGNISFNLITKEVMLDVLLGVDFMFDLNAMKLMADKIDSFPNLEGVDINRKTFVKSLNEMMDWKRAAKYREEMTLFGNPKEFPSEVEHTLHFTSLSLKWNDAVNAYQSYGKIGIGNVMNHQVNRMVDGFIEITKKRTGDMMDIYFDLDNKQFYYFGYTRGNMQTFSSNNDFVQIIRDLPLRSREMKIKRGQTPFIYMIASDTKLRGFLRDYRKRIKGQGQTEEQSSDQPALQPVNQQQDEKPKDNQPAENKPKEGEVIEVK